MEEKEKTDELSRDTKVAMAFDAEKKSVGVAYFLWFFLGYFGAHRFYLERTDTAIVLLLITIASFLLILTGIGLIGLGIVGIWVLVDIFLIPGIVKEANLALMQRLSN